MRNKLINVTIVFATGLVAAVAVVAEELPDPTNPAGQMATRSAPVRGVQSILITPQRKQAVINGRSLAVGDRVNNAVIVDIQPYEVILKRGGVETRMRLVPRLDKQKKEGGAS